jgi:hypothetical protein
MYILAKNGLGYILGDFFSNSSGHPAFLFLAGTAKRRGDVWPSTSKLTDRRNVDKITKMSIFLPNRL